MMESKLGGNWVYVAGPFSSDNTGVSDFPMLLFIHMQYEFESPYPGGRFGSISWTTSDGKAFMFGGYGLGQSYVFGTRAVSQEIQ